MFVDAASTLESLRFPTSTIARIRGTRRNVPTRPAVGHYFSALILHCWREILWRSAERATSDLFAVDTSSATQKKMWFWEFLVQKLLLHD